MTPLAHMVSKEVTLPLRRRSYAAGSDDSFDYLPRRMDDIHCFDVTDVYPLAVEMATNIAKIAGGEATLFLPAPKTWIEWRMPGGDRYGLHLEEHPTKAGYIYRTDAWHTKDQNFFGTMMQRHEVDLTYGAVGREDPSTNGWWAEGFHPDNLLPVFFAAYQFSKSNRQAPAYAARRS